MTGPVIPQGEIDQPLVILALTLVVPLLAAYFGIQYFHQRAVTTGASVYKKKRT